MIVCLGYFELTDFTVLDSVQLQFIFLYFAVRPAKFRIESIRCGVDLPLN